MLAVNIADAGSGAVAALMLMVTFSEQRATPVVELILSLFAMLAFWSLPAAIVVAIVRYRLYDIDRLVSRAVAYLIVAGVLSGIYAVAAPHTRSDIS